MRYLYTLYDAKTGELMHKGTPAQLVKAGVFNSSEEAARAWGRQHLNSIAPRKWRVEREVLLQPKKRPAGKTGGQKRKVWFYRMYGEAGKLVSVGSDGAFTGAASCLGYVLFFKEHCIHKLYGTKPSDYQMSSVRCRGVAANAAKSLCVIAETLYYLSPDGVMAWSGSLPSKVSGALDTGKLTAVDRAVGGQLDARYYLYLHRKTEDGGRLLVYDTERGVWQEESTAGTGMVSTGQQLYLWDGSALWAADPEREAGGEDETELKFEAVTGDIGLAVPDDKYISRVTLRMDALAHTVLTVAVSYDGGDWETVSSCAVTKDHQRVNLPFVPRRHDTMRLKFAGTGQMALRSMAFTFADATGARVSGAVPGR